MKIYLVNSLLFCNALLAMQANVPALDIRLLDQKVKAGAQLSDLEAATWVCYFSKKYDNGQELKVSPKKENQAPQRASIFELETELTESGNFVPSPICASLETELQKYKKKKKRCIVQ